LVGFATFSGWNTFFLPLPGSRDNSICKNKQNPPNRKICRPEIVYVSGGSTVDSGKLFAKRTFIYKNGEKTGMDGWRYGKNG